MTGNAAKRARKLAKPVWGDTGRNHQAFEELLNEEFFLNQTTEWSFDWTWKGQGDWSDYKQYEIQVPAIIAQPIQFIKSLNSSVSIS
jgi:hypothetical protein